MKQNIYITSMRRQPIRTIILVVLMALAAFTFVVRTVEYVIVRRQLYEIAGHYRSIGFIQAVDDDYGTGNIIGAVQQISDSPYIAYHDIRRGARANLVGLINADTRGYEFFWPSHDVAGHAFFYGTVANVGGMFMHVDVDYVVAGYSEHVEAGQDLRIRTIEAAPLAGDRYMGDGVWAPFEPHGIGYIPHHVLDSFEVGRRYFFRAAFYRREFEAPIAGRNNPLVLQPLADDIWVIPADEGRAVLPGDVLGSIEADIATLEYYISRINLRTSVDMTAIPTFQPGLQLWRLDNGRLLDLDDYREARHVTVIHQRLARKRGLEVGDTITIRVPTANYVSFVTQWIRGTGPTDTVSTHTDFLVDAKPNGPVYELELEIVGTFSHGRITRGAHISSTFQYVWIPDSVMPAGHSLLFPDNLHWEFNDVLGWHQPIPSTVDIDSAYFIPSIWYGFILGDVRSEPQFLVNHRSTLEAMGYRLEILPHRGVEFWAAASVALQAVTINLVAFWLVFVLVLALVVFLYVRVRRKDFAIMRALGTPASTALRQLMLSVVVFGLPAVIVGGFAAWRVALRGAAGTLNPIAEVQDAQGFETGALISVWWLVGMVAAVFVGMAVLIFVGAVKQSRRNVLALLQLSVKGS